MVTVTVNEMQFGFMPERGTIDAVFILMRMQEEYNAEQKKLWMYLVNVEKGFDGVPRDMF